MYKLRTIAEFRTEAEAMAVIDESDDCERHLCLKNHSCNDCPLFHPYSETPCTYIVAKARVFLWEKCGIVR